MTSERRGAPRFPFDAQARVRLRRGDSFVLVVPLDISERGVGVSLPERPKLGIVMTVSILAPSGSEVEIEAVVRHVEEAEGDGRFRLGLEFRNLDAERKALIDAAILAAKAKPRQRA